MAAISIRENIRKEYLRSFDDKIRFVMTANFHAQPVFEDAYLSGLENDKKLFPIYKSWILAQWPSTFQHPRLEDGEQKGIQEWDDETYYELRKIILSRAKQRNAANGKTEILYDEQSLYLLLDILQPHIETIMQGSLLYSGLATRISKESSDSQAEWYSMLEKAMEQTAFQALAICDEPENQQEGYPSFLLAFQDKFRTLFGKKLNIESFAKFSEDDQAFIPQFTAEWENLMNFQDDFFGFVVQPKISIMQMVRFLKLPFEHRKSFGEISSSKTYSQVINYIVAYGTFRPVPDVRIKKICRDIIFDIFKPLREKVARTVFARHYEKAWDNFSEMERVALSQEVDRIFVQLMMRFQYFYKTTKRTQEKGKGEDALLAPIGFNKEGVRPGNLEEKVQENTKYTFGEYPFGEYISRSLQLELEKQLRGGVADLEPIDDMSNLVEKYDYINDSGEAVGWTIDTFARIARVSTKTLRRWDNSDQLPAQRGRWFLSKQSRKRYQIRFYTKQNLGEATEVRMVNELKMKHRK